MAKITIACRPSGAATEQAEQNARVAEFREAVAALAGKFQLEAKVVDQTIGPFRIDDHAALQDMLRDRPASYKGKTRKGRAARRR